MKAPVVDYRSFRPSRINEPQYRHLKLWLTWLVYFALYFITENLIPAERCHAMHCALDDIIPFCEWFLIPYAGWYLLIVFSLLYFTLYDVESFKRLQVYIFITQLVAMAVYIIYPSRQDLRPLVFERDNILTRIMGIIYAFDTNTGVCPSLHVAYSLGIASVWLKKKDASVVWKVILVIFVIAIC
ncbi:MAG: hypothetical protein K6A77_05690, partial [Clostridiales bacterium]|nr:hypothetical protein [Clostridiales bacterium]